MHIALRSVEQVFMVLTARKNVVSVEMVTVTQRQENVLEAVMQGILEHCVNKGAQMESTGLAARRDVPTVITEVPATRRQGFVRGVVHQDTWATVVTWSVKMGSLEQTVLGHADGVFLVCRVISILVSVLWGVRKDLLAKSVWQRKLR